MTRVHTEALPCGELVGRHLAGKLDPSGALALEALQDEALATEEARAQALGQVVENYFGGSKEALIAQLDRTGFSNGSLVATAARVAGSDRDEED